MSRDIPDILQSGYRYALSLTHHEPDAEDLVHDAWLKVYAKYGKRITKALLFTAIRNRYVDQYRRNQLAVFEAFDEETYKDSAENLETSFSAEELDQSLSQLKSEEREAIYLNIVEGYSAREIAEITDTSRNTVLSHIHRGKQKLKQILTTLNRRNNLQG